MRLAREGEAAPPPPAGGGHLKVGLGEQQMVWPVERRAMDRRAADAGDRQPMRRRARPQAKGGDDGELVPPTLAAASEPEVALVPRPRGRCPAEHPATPLLLVQAAVLNIGRGDAKRRRRAAGAARTS